MFRRHWVAWGDKIRKLQVTVEALKLIMEDVFERIEKLEGEVNELNSKSSTDND